MPTLSEAPASADLPWPPALCSLEERRDAVLLSLTRRGIRPRPLVVLAAALDLGLSEENAVEVASSLERLLHA